jgi:putative restriction endonuclease
VRSLRDYVQLTPAAAREQRLGIQARSAPAAGRRQVDFVPVEAVLSLAASLLVNHRQATPGRLASLLIISEHAKNCG